MKAINRILNTKTDSTPVILAPMAGVTDLAFREISMLCGCDFTYSEMVSAKAISYNNSRTFRLMTYSETAKPFGIQLFGHEPFVMADTAARVCDMCGDDLSLIDINMGCPAPKIVNNGDGSALMKDMLLASKVIEFVAKRNSRYTTVKFRKGWDDNNINAVEFAKMAEDSGADLITIHGRTRAQMYSGEADTDLIRRVKEAVSIPVIGNGDITDAESAKRMLKETNCDGIMIGRGAQGNPFIFEEVRAMLENREYEPPSIEKRIETMLLHAQLHEKYKTKAAFSEMRKHIAWYTKGLRGAGRLRSSIFECESIEEVKGIIDEFVRENNAVL